MSKPIYPTSTSSFRTIRENGWFYVDKTAYIHRMATEGQYYFLSRPRRFGKSLLVSTMEAYFKGCKELFSGLEMERLEERWQPYEVLRLDLSAGDMSCHDGLLSRLMFDLASWEKTYGCGGEGDSLAIRFQSIIRRGAARSGRGVVILIDEYDNPLFSSIDNRTEYEKIRTTLKGIYSVIKAETENVRFCFLTGITRFSKMSVFSGLNNLNDLTLAPSYSAVCGITGGELESVCRQGVESLAETLAIPVGQTYMELKRMYDGYHFGAMDVDVYNPFSLMNSFAEGAIRPYWFASGTSQFLWKRIASHTDRRSMERIMAPMLDFSELGVSEEGGLSLSGLLFQTGYLTIKEHISGLHAYRLGIPNAEVREGLLKGLLPVVSRQEPEMVKDDLYQLRKYGSNGEIDRMLRYLKSYLAGVSYRLTGKMPEIYYENNLFLLFSIIGTDTRIEMETSDGRMDVVLRMGNYIYILELKRDSSAEDGLAQIKRKDYAAQFRKLQMEDASLRIIAAGIDFSSETRNISGWVWEEI